MSQTAYQNTDKASGAWALYSDKTLLVSILYIKNTDKAWRVGHEVPSVVVWPLLLYCEMLGDISSYKAALQSDGKQSIHFTSLHKA